MKKIILLLSVLAITNGCTQSTSLIGPSYTLAKSGSVLQAGNSIVASYGVKKTLNQAVSPMKELEKQITPTFCSESLDDNVITGVLSL